MNAPAVVAVVVTTGPGPDLEVTLASLVEQDYENLSILVLANGDTSSAAARVAAIAPSAFVRLLDANRGFAAASNHVIGAVSGAAFYLFCHDDVRLHRNAVSAMVEGAYRTNAGIVTPKYVGYDDESVLLHVGQMADRFGAVTDRIEAGEIDAGQHDGERDVFVAPGGATLIRCDLFDSLGGFSTSITMIGEDLDFSWRAQIAGARVVVVPSAVVAHRQSVAAGFRKVSAIGTRLASLQDLRRRHQLFTVVSCWSALSLLVIIPLLILFEIAEVTIALTARDTDRVGAVLQSWRFILRQRTEILRRRELIQRQRALTDAGIRLLQVAGASRAQTFVQTLVHEGIDRARGVLPDELLTTTHSQPLISFGGSFSELLEYDELPDFDDQASAVSLRRLLDRFKQQFVVMALVALTWFIGARNLVAMHLPALGRLAPLDSWWANWHHFFASWSPNGVGSGAPGMPGYGLIAASGTLVFGRMGILPKLTLIMAVPIGVYGVGRLLRDVVSNRARLFAALSYMALPVGVNLIQQGRVDLLILFAGMPFLLRRVLALLDVANFRHAPYERSRPFGSRLWGRTRAGQLTKASLLLAVLSAFAPVAIVIVALIVTAVWTVQRLGDGERALERPWATLSELVATTALLLAPMTLDTILAGRRALSLFGLPMASWSSLSLRQVVRAADGGFGTGLWSWVIPIVALTATVLARGERRSLARAFAATSAFAIGLIMLVARHLLGSFAPDVDGLLVVVALGLVGLVAVAVSALEHDVESGRLSWQRVVAGVAVVGLALSPWSIVANASSGRYELPMTSAAEALNAYTPTNNASFRVLWLGDARALPLAGWSVEPGLAAATTTNGGPNGATLFTSPTTSAMDSVLRSLELVTRGETTHVGQLLAPAGIADLVVLTASVPPLAGLQMSQPLPPPATLLEGLSHQRDLTLVSSTPGVLIYANTTFHGIVAERSKALATSTTASDADSVLGWTPVLGAAATSGAVTRGEVISGFAPAGAFSLRVNGHPAPRTTKLGWVGAYAVGSGHSRLTLNEFPFNGILAGGTLLAWCLIGFGFGGSERLTDHFGRSSRAKRSRR